MICKNCTRRHARCHVDCEDYKRFKDGQAVISANRAAENIIAGYQIDYFAKHKH